jgi:hypothetical protein
MLSCRRTASRDRTPRAGVRVACADLPAATQALLLAAAVSETGGLEELFSVAEAIEGTRPTVDDLVPATSVRLIEVDRLRVRFSHPLVRSAIYQAASVGQRYAAHGALAKVLADDPERRVWHRTAATVGTDPDVAAELEEAGRRALGRGGIASAAAAFERAAALTPDPAHRGRLLLRAADAASDLGRSDIVMRLLREADSLDLDDHGRARWIWLEDAFHEGAVGDPQRPSAVRSCRLPCSDRGSRRRGAPPGGA